MMSGAGDFVFIKDLMGMDGLRKEYRVVVNIK